MKTIRNTLILLCAGLISQPALSHAEHDKARFVAAKGIDQGRCDNRFRPCKTIAYAFMQANKGDSILVAQGQYAVQSSEELFQLSGRLVPVQGGYSQIDGYQVQSPDQHATVLTGVPLEQAEMLSQQGFTVIVDQKAQQTSQLADAQLLSLMQSKQATEACENGNAGGFACQNISLVAHLPLSEFAGNPSGANDIWGHVDLNTGREYAIIGLVSGLAVVEVTNAEAPKIVGQITGNSSGWRDVKVYQFYDDTQNRWRAYAYSTAEGDASEGLSIVDLSGLPQQISLVTRQRTDTSAHNIYISNVDYSFNIALNGQQPLVHIVGANSFGGAFRSYSVADPEILGATFSPQFTSRSDYTHDASSVLIDDARAQSDCNNPNDQACLVILDFNENSLRLHNHTDINNAELLGETSYVNAVYTHSGWWSEDKQYVFLHDELDERERTLNTTLRVFDISDLTQPTQVGSWVGPTRAIDHNGFVRGNRYYMSNYTRGLTILDISDPSAPTQVGYFDTYPASDNASFFGAWGVYPFLPSGNILVSDINSGLFVLQDNTRDQANSIGFSQALLEAEEGQTASIEVVRTGTQSTQVNYDILLGSATATDLLNLQNGTLSWAANDTSTLSIDIPIANDQLNEADESVFVRLSNPTNGSALGQVSISQLNIVGSTVNTGVIRATEPDISVRENQATVEVQVTRDFGSDGELTIDYQLQSDTALAGDDISLAPGQLTWADGDNQTQTLTLTIVDDELTEGDESLTLTFSADDPATLGTSQVVISIRDDESNQAPTVDAGDDLEVNTRQSVTINANVNDEDEQTLSYSWQQTAGTALDLVGADSATMSFVAPDSADELSFALSVTDEFGAETSDSVSVTVVAPASTPAPTTPTTNSGGSGGGGSLYYLLMLAMAVLHLRTAAFFCNRRKSQLG